MMEDCGCIPTASTDDTSIDVYTDQAQTCRQIRADEVRFRIVLPKPLPIHDNEALQTARFAIIAQTLRSKRSVLPQMHRPRSGTERNGLLLHCRSCGDSRQNASVDSTMQRLQQRYQNRKDTISGADPDVANGGCGIDHTTPGIRPRIVSYMECGVLMSAASPAFVDHMLKLTASSESITNRYLLQQWFRSATSAVSRLFCHVHDASIAD